MNITNEKCLEKDYLTSYSGENRINIFPLSLVSRKRHKTKLKLPKNHHEEIVLSLTRDFLPLRLTNDQNNKRQRSPSGGVNVDTVKGNGGFGDYSAAGEFEVWGDEQRTTDGEDHQVIGPPSRGLLQQQHAHHQLQQQLQQQQQRCNDANVSSLRPLLHVAHCELHSPREAELLRLDQLESLDRKSVERDPYSMMDNFHSPVPPPLPRRHGRKCLEGITHSEQIFVKVRICVGIFLT
ncbi:hypothetical protein PV325_004550 [Microctonus aethiopoides]|nr:hypothetical protein PV325_004550 [Microctonus aethiopoides]KAK0086006.1 hypothetical protein PV326_005717 [Microctonus aethiopoides]